MTDRERFDSWKEIARYLGRDVRTVLRWERGRGLPVYRVPGGKLSRVFAYRDELDRWLEGDGLSASTAMPLPDSAASRESDAPHHEPAEAIETAPPDGNGSSRLSDRGRWEVGVPTAAGAVLLVVAAVGVSLWTRPVAPIARVVSNGNELRAVDVLGTTRWTHRDVSAEFAVDSSRVTDLDGDGREDVVASVGVMDAKRVHHGGMLAAFDASGRVRWSYKADDHLAFRDGEYGPPWAADGLMAYRSGKATRIAWAVHHFTWWPSLLLTFDAAGTRLGTFVNSGWIRGASPVGDGRFLLVTGVANSWQAYFAAVLDADNPTGHSPEREGSPMECLTCPAGDPLAYYVLPRTDVSRHQPFPSFGPSVMPFPNGTVEVHSPQSDGPTVAAVIYDFAAGLTLRGARFADSFWEWHRLLEASGELDHPIDRCPERQGLEVQRWTPAEGWQTVRVPVR